MDVDGPGAISSPGTEEETIARKRSRRVSFADTTAVHVFDRDEDIETPPEERSASLSPSPGRFSAEVEDGDETSDAGSPAPPIVFLPDIDSSSPGSAAGSVVSADDENFFGPVSTSFIQTGRPSDAGISEDDNHDITLDSRTFSRHFLNVVPPEECTANSVGSLRTPDTASKGPLEELNVSEPGIKSSSGRDALTDMSMLSNNPRTYDYGKLSPMLNDVLQKIERGKQRNSPVAGIADVNPDQAYEKEHREDNLCINNGISSNELGAFSITKEQISMRNAVSISRDPIQEDNVMVTDGLEKYQENCNPDQVSVDPCVSNTVEPHTKLLPRYNSELYSTDAIRASSMSGFELEVHRLDQSSSRNQLPKTDNIMNTSRLSGADPVICRKDTEQLPQLSEVMDTETIPCTPLSAVQQLEVPQGSILSCNPQRQKLFSVTPVSNCKVACQEPSSLSVEVVKHDQRIAALENLLKVRHQESPAVSRLPLVERNELGLTENDIFRNSEDHAVTISVELSSVPRQQLKRTGESLTPGSPAGQGLNEAARSPKKSRKQLTSASEPPVSLKVFKEKQSGDNDIGQSVNVDWNKIVCTVSNATERLLAASISKLNLQQLNTLGDKLDDFQVARKYRRLSNVVRVEDCCGDKQKRLAEARSLHERLLHEKAKLQISKVKLAKLQSKSQQCQIGIQECSFLKDKILDASQMNNTSLHDKSLISSSNNQEWLPVVSKRRLEYAIIQQKLESLRSSLEYSGNNRVDISCQSVMRFAEEHSDMRNQCHIIQQQAGLPELMDIIKRDNKRDIILNYRNLLFQRIILNISDVSSIFVNSLNGTKIGQAFPDLDATVAFHYIFKTEQNQSVSDLQLLQKKTMETSLLLGNLVDVLDEIKFAKVKLLNLTSAVFVLESQTCQLALRVCFMSFKSGKSIGFTIDMTDLNRSVYPSEPSELLIKLCQAQTTLSQSSIEEIMVSIRNLQPGRMIILRLCRMVSDLIQSLPC